MGGYAYATLAYGVPLGGGEHEWTFTDDVDEYGRWKPEWIIRDDREGADDSYVRRYGPDPERRLRDVGFTAEFIFQGAGAPRCMEGIGIAHFGQTNGGGLGYVLRAWEAAVNTSDLAGRIDMAEMERRRVAESWDDRLRAALDVLGVHPSEEPGWLLLANYG